jgi:hypothetical protein
MRARWYSPSIGRFLSEDPIGFSGGMNWYAYADGNPISLSDPFGLASVKILYSSGKGYNEKILDNPTPEILNTTIGGMGDKSIKAIQFNGHGSRKGIFYNNNNDSLWIYPDDGAIYTDDVGTKLSSILGPKLENMACVNFAGCNTASVLGFGSNVSKVASDELPGAVVTGNVTFDLMNELSVPFFRSTSTGPLTGDHTEMLLGRVKSYQDGGKINTFGSGKTYWYNQWKNNSQMNQTNK